MQPVCSAVGLPLALFSMTHYVAKSIRQLLVCIQQRHQSGGGRGEPTCSDSSHSVLEGSSDDVSALLSSDPSDDSDFGHAAFC